MNNYQKIRKDLEEKYPKFKTYLDEISKSSPEEKDLLLAHYLIFTGNTLNILEKIIKSLEIIAVDSKHKKILNKEIKEIENTISLGIPGWLNYTRRTKKRKK
ncbi:MAG: hypothetical protein Q7S77_02865 [Candidatus Staskawiczbacteria bacterium]|nr:hypothetical protein [Candidatus Staskawiczbacteria bacterium]